LHECIHSSKASGATPADALACPHGTSQHLEGKRVLTETSAFAGPSGYHCKGSGATFGDSHPFLKRINA
jgi:hypothetical protein